MLNQHDDITCHGEVFHKKQVLLRGTAAMDEAPHIKTKGTPRERRESLLDSVFGLKYGRVSGSGFKIFEAKTTQY